jgi:hypothetical protein
MTGDLYKSAAGVAPTQDTQGIPVCSADRMSAARYFAEVSTKECRNVQMTNGEQLGHSRLVILSSSGFSHSSFPSLAS